MRLGNNSILSHLALIVHTLLSFSEYFASSHFLFNTLRDRKISINFNRNVNNYLLIKAMRLF